MFKRLLLVFIALISCLAFLMSSAAERTLHGKTQNSTRFSLPPNDTSLILIPFEYKQSALYHLYTYEVIDSIVAILKNNKLITLSIDGFAHVDEGTDYICYYLSLNRARFVRDYVLGRGIDSSRIVSTIGFGNTRPAYLGRDEKGRTLNCRVELKLNYPKVVKRFIANRDGDALPDSIDACPDVYGYIDSNGCPNRAIVVPFEPQQSSLSSSTYQVLDSVIMLLKRNPAYTLSIEGHAYEEEGNMTVCEGLSRFRSEIVRSYLLSRYIAPARIDSIKSMGIIRPLNAGRTPMEIAANSRVEVFINPH